MEEKVAFKGLFKPLGLFSFYDNAVNILRRQVKLFINCCHLWVIKEWNQEELLFIAAFKEPVVSVLSWDKMKKVQKITFDRTLTDHFAAILAAFPC